MIIWNALFVGEILRVAKEYFMLKEMDRYITSADLNVKLIYLN